MGESALVAVRSGPKPSWRVAPPRWRLVACPPSGSGPQFYRPLAAEVDARDGELWAARYPGRESRIAEPLKTSVDGLVDDMVPALARLLSDGVPTALLGHSLGVGVAGHAAARIADRHPDVAPALALLVLSAREPRKKRSRSGDREVRNLTNDDDALWAWLGSLGGLPQELLDDADFRAMQLPIVRADLLASRSDNALPRTRKGRLNVPLLLTCGDEDPEVRLSGMTAWQEMTTGDTYTLELTGGHHALLGHATTLLDAIQAQLGLSQR